MSNTHRRRLAVRPAARRLVTLVPLAAFLTALTVGAAVAPPLARAANGISLTTPYPGVDVEPGQSVTFDLTVHNSGGSGTTVAVAVAAAPEGWSTFLKAGTGTTAVNQVYVPGGSSNDVDLQVRPATDAKPGTYHVTVVAESPSGSRYDSLELTLRIVEGGGTGPALSTQYPSLEGSASSTFSYSIDLENRSLTSQTYHFTAQAPDGWKVTFESGFGGKTISTETVDAGGRDTLTVNADPPSQVKAGTYAIRVIADAGGGQTASVDLSATVTGTTDISVDTTNGRLNADATAGHGSNLVFVVSNDGTADAKDVSLYASAPPNWKVEFSDSSVDVPAGGKTQVTATITPDAKAIAGDYDVTVTASSSDSSDSQDIRVAVHTSTLWGIVGILVVLAVVAGLLFVFRVYGRR